MLKRTLIVLMAAFSFLILHAQPVPQKREEKALVKGMKINKTTKIKTGIYKLDGFDSLGQSVIIIEGNNITVDFNNATLKGSNQKKILMNFLGLRL